MVMIQLISDLHLEFHRDRGHELIENIPVESDILVIAGDFCPIVDGTTIWSDAMTRLLERFKHVVYVPGNHEYFESSFKDVADFLPRYARGRQNFHVLLNNRKIVENIPFIGTTLWYGPEVNGMLECEVLSISDSHLIPAMNLLGKEYLRNEIQEGDIVVTHHLPSYNSVAHRFIGDPLNMFFVSDCEQIIKTCKPKLWFHGHTHIGCDYVFDKTRIVCNPHGYPREFGSKFNPGYLIEY